MKEKVMNSLAERVPEIANRIERRGVCSHCGWYKDVSEVKTDGTLAANRVGDVKSSAKYRIIM